MSNEGSSKLEKLTIYSYRTKERSPGGELASFEALINPSTYNIQYQNEFSSNQGINTSSAEADYQCTLPQNLRFEIILDGTIIHKGSNSKILSVKDRIDDFMSLFYMHGDIHSPPFLKISWGDMLWRGMHFDCVLGSVDIAYTLFDKSGSPLRASLNVVFIEDLSDKKRCSVENKNSPDLTHTRIIDSSTKLPLLTGEIYQNPLMYLAVAEVNELNNFRSLKPGTHITLPPVKNTQIDKESS